MKILFYQLSRPFAYLRIAHPQKAQFDWALPVLLALLSTIACYLLRYGTNFVGTGGLVGTILSFVQNLPGFYIAALAAIAVFREGSIDQVMPDPAPTVEMEYGGQTNRITLTRRHFLCMLTAFLSAESLLFCFASALVVNFSPAIRALVTSAYRDSALYIFIFVYFLVFWQMIVATLLGLYYLGDRLHIQDPSKPGT